MLYTFSTNLEKNIKTRIIHFFKLNKLMSKNQLGFRLGLRSEGYSIMPQHK